MKTNTISNNIPCLVTIMNVKNKGRQLITSSPLAQCKLDCYLKDTINQSIELSTSYPKTPVGFKLMFLPQKLSNLQILAQCPSLPPNHFPTDNLYIIQTLHWGYNHPSDTSLDIERYI